jgi:hypothetical protein
MDPELLSALARIEEKIDRLLSGSRPASAPVAVSVDADPVVRMDPKKWTGPTMKGKPMSACPSEGLTMLVGLYEWCADKDREAGKQAKSDENRALAAKAREWASKPRSSSVAVDDQELPF